jgi:Ca2+-binding RTX toxin-like protein
MPLFVYRPSDMEVLEPRTLLSAGGPSPREQQMLELINRLRAHPADELPLILNSKDQDIQNALNFFGVDRKVLANQWAGLSPEAPLAWSDALAKSAKTHTERMLATDTQSHQLPGEAPLLGRVQTAGYGDAAFVGENVFAFMDSVEHAHAGFAVDWGNAPDGIQNPPGHRDNLMAGLYSEVGISILDGKPGKNTGPYLITEDFGSRREQNPYLLGVIYDDKNKDGCYTPGEALPNVTVMAVGKAGTFVTTTMSAGGYQMQLPPGTYTVTATGGGLRGVATSGNFTVAGDNVKRDFTKGAFRTDTAGPSARFAVAPRSAAGGATEQTFTVNYSDAGAVNASTLSTGDVRVTGPHGFSTLAQLVSTTGTGASRTATYKFAAPGGFFDSADNGRYSVSLQAGQVSDLNGNFASSTTIGSVTVNVPPAVLTTNGVLVVNGTPGKDTINVSVSGRTLTAKVNGGSYTFDYTKVRRIYVSSMEGDDSITLAGPIMGTTADGGLGNDTIVGGPGDDTLQGNGGSDVLMGNAGNDSLWGGGSGDRLDGGAGNDRVQRDVKDLLTSIETVLA